MDKIAYAEIKNSNCVYKYSIPSIIHLTIFPADRLEDNDGTFIEPQGNRSTTYIRHELILFVWMDLSRLKMI